MSPRDWAECPQCRKRLEARKERAAKKAESIYGKVPDVEYRKWYRRGQRPVKVPEHMREDYQIGVSSEGLFEVYYHASCSDCGYSFDYELQEQTKLA